MRSGPCQVHQVRSSYLSLTCLSADTCLSTSCAIFLHGKADTGAPIGPVLLMKCIKALPY